MACTDRAEEYYTNHTGSRRCEPSGSIQHDHSESIDELVWVTGGNILANTLDGCPGARQGAEGRVRFLFR